MSVYDTPYYGQRQKALTGMSYGPYYGMTFPGGGALPTDEGRRALTPEISDKYQAIGTPAVAGERTSGGTWEGDPSQPMEGEFGARDARAIGAMYLGMKSPDVQQPQSPAWGIATTGARMAGSYLGGPLVGTFVSVASKMIGALLVSAFPSLSSKGYGAPTTEYSPAPDYGPTSGYSPGPGSFDPSADTSSSGYAAPGGFDPSGGLSTGSSEGGTDSGFGGWD